MLGLLHRLGRHRTLHPRPGRKPIRSRGGSDGLIQEQRSHGRAHSTGDEVDDPREGAGGRAYGHGREGDVVPGRWGESE